MSQAKHVGLDVDQATIVAHVTDEKVEVLMKTFFQVVLRFSNRMTAGASSLPDLLSQLPSGLPASSNLEPSTIDLQPCAGPPLSTARRVIH